MTLLLVGAGGFFGAVARSPVGGGLIALDAVEFRQSPGGLAR